MRIAILVLLCGVPVESADESLPVWGIFRVGSYAGGAPFVARLVAESATELKLAPAGGGEVLAVPPSSVDRLNVDREPLKGYVAAYAELLGCSWVTVPGKRRPTVGRQLPARDDKAYAMLLNAKGLWEETESPEGGLLWGAPLSTREIESILGPVPSEGAGSEPSIDPAVCSRCGGKCEIACPVCERGKVRVDCPECRGRGKVRCERCKGTGGTPCTYCKGTGSIRQYRLNGQQFLGKCERCAGRGRITCAACKGKNEDECAECRGSGKVEETCSRCAGTRKIKCPSCKPGAVQGEAAAAPVERSGGRIVYARVTECAAVVLAREAEALLGEDAARAQAALAEFKDVGALYRKQLQSPENLGFRKGLAQTRKTQYREIMALYQRGVALQTELSNFGAAAGRQRELLSPDAIASLSTPDAAFARVQSARETMARYRGKADVLRATGADLRAALGREWSAFRAQTDKDAQARLYMQGIAVALEDLENVKVLAANRDEGILTVRITPRTGAGVQATLDGVAGRVFSEFDDVVDIVILGREPTGITRSDWDEARALAAADATAAPAPAPAAAPAEDSSSSRTGILMLLCGGVVVSFVLLALMIRGRRNDERYSLQ